ncbi:Txe/YoeB family toxin of toxin-antitoxin system [Streptomyces sp. B3I7]|nr:Txe/YoeB family toxin of toxin-antitoxin system [Streptomyces sp. B3I7]
MVRDPYEGIGEPEPLKHALTGAWSRRITDEHRLVYLPLENEVIVLQARHHYT